MPKLSKLKNKAFAEIGSGFLEAWRAQQGCKQYLAHLVRRCQARASARRVREDTYASAIGAIRQQILSRSSLVAKFKDDAVGFRRKPVRRLPAVSEADAGLPAALLADSARAAREMPTVRHLVTGREFVLQVGPKDSLHDFYVKAKEALGLDPKGSVSLALLRTGIDTTGADTSMKTREQRTLGCSRGPGSAMRNVKGKVFEAYFHPSHGRAARRKWSTDTLV